jgi:hypothetical protein
MKRFFKLFLSLALVFTIVLGGCSCTPPVPLAFKPQFNGGEKFDGFSSETLTYDISYVNGTDDYLALKKSSVLNDLISDFKVESGSFVTKLSIDFQENDKIKKSELYGENGIVKPNSPYYLLETTMNYTGKLILKNGVEHEFTDTITTLTYFLPESSFAPLYASHVSQMSLISTGENAVSVSSVKYVHETIYGNSEYTIDSKVYSKGGVTYDLSKNEKAEQVKADYELTQEERETFEYDLKTVIDNTQLLFVIRNFETAQDKTSTLPVIAPSYKETASLAIMQTDTATPKLNFSYNGNTAKENETIPVRKLGFALNDAFSSGQMQYLVYQTGKSSAETPTVENRALLVEYAFPLPVYGSMSILGGLKCTLKSVTLN